MGLLPRHAKLRLDGGKGVSDVVGYAGGEHAEARHLLLVHHLSLHPPFVGYDAAQCDHSFDFAILGPHREGLKPHDFLSAANAFRAVSGEWLSRLQCTTDGVSGVCLGPWFEHAEQASTNEIVTMHAPSLPIRADDPAIRIDHDDPLLDRIQQQLQELAIATQLLGPFSDSLLELLLRLLERDSHAVERDR
jgi:hypothetical protein